MAEISVTIKQQESRPKAMDGVWFVFRGEVDEVKRDLGLAFGVPTEGLTLFEVATNAAAVARGTLQVTSALDGEFIPEDRAQSPGTDTPAPTESKAPSPEEVVTAKIAAAKAMSDLEDIWVKHKDLIVGDVRAAWKAKGKEFKG